MTIATSYYNVSPNSADGTQVGASATATPNAGKVGFYGKVPVVQRPYSSAVHATSGYASSGSFGPTQLAIVVEIASTLVGLGIWASA